MTDGVVHKAPAGASNVKTFKIYRWSPDDDAQPRIDAFDIDLDDCGPMVLDALIKIKNETPLNPPLKGILILYLFFKSFNKSSIESLLPPPEPGLLLPDDEPQGPSMAKILNLFLITIQYM